MLKGDKLVFLHPMRNNASSWRFLPSYAGELGIHYGIHYEIHESFMRNMIVRWRKIIRGSEEGPLHSSFVDLDLVVNGLVSFIYVQTVTKQNNRGFTYLPDSNDLTVWNEISTGNLTRLDFRTVLPNLSDPAITVHVRRHRQSLHLSMSSNQGPSLFFTYRHLLLDYFSVFSSRRQLSVVTALLNPYKYSW